jgi:hypothetical protein
MLIFQVAPMAILAQALLSSPEGPLTEILPMTLVTDLELEKQAGRGFCLRGDHL